MTEQVAGWLGVHALECFLGILIFALAVVFMAWDVIGSAYGEFEKFAVRLGRVLGIRLSSPAKRVLIPVLIITAGLVPLHIMVDLSENVFQKESLALFDEALTDSITRNSNAVAVNVFRIITFFGNPVVLAFTSGGVGLILAFRRRWTLLTLWFTSIGFGALGSLELKSYFERPRPEALLPHVPEVSGWAFPSGHAMNGVIVYGMLTYVLLRRVGAGERRIILMIATGLVLAIGFSRIYLGVHYLSDVLAGYASGLFWLALCISVFEVLGQGFSSLDSFKGV
jgi:membrane-associated phospholipid phosphatase